MSARILVMHEGRITGEFFYGQAPEIDGVVVVEGKAEVGEMVPVKITGAMAYDLTGGAV